VLSEDLGVFAERRLGGLKIEISVKGVIFVKDHFRAVKTVQREVINHHLTEPLIKSSFSDGNRHEERERCEKRRRKLVISNLK